MKWLLGYMQLESPDGTCVEVINGARTLALMRLAKQQPSGPEGCRVHPDWRLRTSPRVWEGNDCWAFNTGQYGADPAFWENPAGEQDPNPWEDPDKPHALEVAGFLPDPPGPGLGLVLQSPMDPEVLGADRVEELELSISGTVVAGTARGEHSWLQWFDRVMTGCDYTRGWTATVFTHCPDQTVWDPIVDPFDLPSEPSGEPTYSTWDDVSPPLLTEWTDPTPWPLDSGVWQLFQVKFRGRERLFDQPEFDHCVGQRYVLRFGVKVHTVYDRPRTLASIGGAGEWAAGETYSTPLQAGDGTVDTDPLQLGPPGLVLPPPAVTAGLKGRPGRWALPDAVLREAALTPPRPTTLTDQLVITIRNPSTSRTIHNARVRIWEALVGYPHPNTQVGDAFYRERDPEAELRIVKLQPAETLIYDGRTKRVTLREPGFIHSVVPGRVESRSGTRLDLPPLRCDRRYWACAELSADSRSYGDLDMEVTIQGAQEQIPT